MLLGNIVLYVPGLLQLNLFLPADVADSWGCAMSGSAVCCPLFPAIWQN